ncbi:WG repeat-containing protein [Runella slithyformis]|uniref:KWG Leptospira repeat protein n=1 Tax=Runella slithyformis (strain ATCC 29530 / DSM 19594 / LMG 11500 / NCIMB 11436 / LSU 4) TaxID=761193 RepID=A0A7U4E8J3_RUNSL|nr:WG repeat-containing protein [Runella slithyformis]AEI51504.1 KWG Leptospira repeat protein [Runella slithyformis DSM 19594]
MNLLKHVTHLSVYFLFFLALTARSQPIRQITKKDERDIKLGVRNLLTNNLPGIYRIMLSSTAVERKEYLNRLTTPGEERVFLNDNFYIENDFYIRNRADLPKKERDLSIQDYFTELAKNFGRRDNDEDPNEGKEVKIPSITFLKNIQCRSAKDSTLFIKALFTIDYDGIAINKFPFKPEPRIAEIQVEKEGKRWRLYIRSLRFMDERENLAEDFSKNVAIIENSPSKTINYEEALSSETKTVSRIPLLKAFKMGELWGLLNDEDNVKKIVITPQFDELDEFSEDDMAPVSLGGSWGFINKNGVIVIPCQYQMVEPFKKGKALVQTWGGAKPFSIDVTGKQLK